jgi:hypothetical protein
MLKIKKKQLKLVCKYHIKHKIKLESDKHQSFNRVESKW